MTVAKWWLARDGQRHGPLNDAEMRKLIELGHLKPVDFIWCEGWSEWKPASIVLSVLDHVVDA